MAPPAGRFFTLWQLACAVRLSTLGPASAVTIDRVLETRGGAALPTAGFGNADDKPPLAKVHARSATVTVDTSRVTHRPNELMMGCHLDLGFVHAQRNYYSQMIYGESFEFGDQSSYTYTPPVWDSHPSATLIRWNNYSGGTSRQSVRYDRSEARHGFASLRVEHTSSMAGDVGVTNRGIGNEGLAFKHGQIYDGYLFVKTLQATAPVTVVVMLRNYLDNATLARQEIVVAGSLGWQKLSFNLTATGSTSCEGIVPGSDPRVDCNVMRVGGNAHAGDNGQGTPNANQGHVCVRCGGEFMVGLAAGTAWFDYVFLSDERYGKGGPFLKRGVDDLKRMGITGVRLGGSYAIKPYWDWRKWRGPAEDRPSVGAKWGSSLMSGFGMFDFLAMCEEAKIEPIVTLAAQWVDRDNQSNASSPVIDSCCKPEDLADIVEYLAGNESTHWGQQRIQDGHPERYSLKMIELGNEELNTDFPAQVRAMEERAKQVGLHDHYIYLRWVLLILNKHGK